MVRPSPTGNTEPEDLMMSQYNRLVLSGERDAEEELQRYKNTSSAVRQTDLRLPDLFLLPLGGSS